MPRLIFQAADVRRIVEHSLAAPQQRPMAYTENDPVAAPSVLLVHDQGVYLMSNGTPGDIIDTERNQHFVAYAKGCHPAKDDDWWDTARDLVGGDDFAETLPWAQQIKAALDRGVNTIAINFGKSKISFVA
jgi:hypothetical protein